MSLVFHRFKTAAEAVAFAYSVQGFWPELQWSVCSTQEHSNAIDPFPFTLEAPIVLIDHSVDEDIDRAVEAFVADWSGEFAGT